MPPDRFDPQSHDSMFARILAEMESDRRARESFREEVRERFDRGASRMDDLDAKIDAVHTETRKTNGRVTRLESEKRILLARAAAISACLSTLLAAIIWLYDRGIFRLGP